MINNKPLTEIANKDLPDNWRNENNYMPYKDLPKKWTFKSEGKENLIISDGWSVRTISIHTFLKMYDDYVHFKYPASPLVKYAENYKNGEIILTKINQSVDFTGLSIAFVRKNTPQYLAAEFFIEKIIPECINPFEKIDATPMAKPVEKEDEQILSFSLSKLETDQYGLPLIIIADKNTGIAITVTHKEFIMSWGSVTNDYDYEIRIPKSMAFGENFLIENYKNNLESSYSLISNNRKDNLKKLFNGKIDKANFKKATDDKATDDKVKADQEWKYSINPNDKNEIIVSNGKQTAIFSINTFLELYDSKFYNFYKTLLENKSYSLQNKMTNENLQFQLLDTRTGHPYASFDIKYFINNKMINPFNVVSDKIRIADNSLIEENIKKSDLRADYNESLSKRMELSKELFETQVKLEEIKPKFGAATVVINKAGEELTKKNKQINAIHLQYAQDIKERESRLKTLENNFQKYMDAVHIQKTEIFKLKERNLFLEKQNGRLGINIFGKEQDNSYLRNEIAEIKHNSFGNMTKRDLTQAAYRVGATQMIKALRAAIVSLLSSQGRDNNTIQAMTEILNSDIGIAMLSCMCGYSIEHFVEENEVASKFAQELRVHGMTLAGNSAFETLFGLITSSIVPILSEANEKEKVRIAETENENIEENDEMIEESFVLESARC